MKRVNTKGKFVLHIFPKEKFTDGYVELINKNFSKNKHVFLLYGDNFNTVCENEDNVIVLNQKWSNLFLYLKLLYKSKSIIVHSLSNIRIEMSIFFQPWLLSKLNILFWGADLYFYREKKIRLKTKLHEVIRRILIKNAKYITTLVPDDYKLAKQWYKVKGISLSGIYIDLALQDNLNIIKKNQCKDYDKKKVINIQIGNNAQRSNRHIEAIDLISHFKDRNIKVYIPLSYSGEKEYVTQVIEHGEKILGDKFAPILEFMPIGKYNQYLSTIDVSIFCNDRQQGMNNINSLVYLESKVFLRSDTAMWKHFTKELGYSIENIEDIPYMSFEEFIEIKQVDAQKNASEVSKLWSESNAVQKWEKIFSNMRMN